MPPTEQPTDAAAATQSTEAEQGRKPAMLRCAPVLGAVTVWVVLVAALAMGAARRQTVTVDEFQHLPSGSLILRTGEFYMHPKSPPLARAWCALPSLFLNASVPVDRRWRELAPGWGAWMYGTAFFLRNQGAYDRIFFWGRLFNLAWLLPLAYALFAWANELYGRRAACLSLLLLGLSPAILAHGPLVTTDLSAAAAVFVATYFFWRSNRQTDAVWCSLAAGAALGVGLLCKFTLVLVPFMWAAAYIPATVVEVMESRRQRSGTSKCSGQARSSGWDWKRTLRVWAVPAVAAVLAVNLGYGCRGVGRSLRDMQCASSALQRLRESPVGRLPLPLPEAFVTGLDAQRGDADSAEFPGFLFGRWSQHGWWYYYAAVFLLKTPTALTVLLALALFCSRKFAKPAEDRWTRLCIACPPAVLFAVLSFGNRLCLGIRYLLPALPFLFLYAGRTMTVTSESPRLRIAVRLCALWFAISSLSQYPAFLSYFTELAGGPKQGHRYLLDSNLDWGQDLYRLAPYMRQNNIPHVKLAYFGHVPPEHYGIAYTPLPRTPEPGVFAASVSYVWGQEYAVTYRDGEATPVPLNAFAWLRKHQPAARLGHSMWVYRITAEDLQHAGQLPSGPDD